MVYTEYIINMMKNNSVKVTEEISGKKCYKFFGKNLEKVVEKILRKLFL